jgi:hypothetical protein
MEFPIAQQQLVLSFFASWVLGRRACGACMDALLCWQMDGRAFVAAHA